ncbi:Response regulator [Vulgatibacter incomptus]|uniref:Response regulator n=1 Tax=Vulgatibacter incomptus TaxID=1391653 RepID=A0A0K1PG03_9BACT|nr:Response regulator [Vulgatibacter incomptus]
MPVALLDLQVSDLDGLEVLRPSQGTPTRVIVVTGYRIVAAVEAMHLVAAKFVQKPVDAPALLPLLEDAAASPPAANTRRPPTPPRSGWPAGAPPLKSAWIGRQRPPVRAAVTGESDAGKKLIARALHQESTRGLGALRRDQLRAGRPRTDERT